jgi:hypothetical protein
VGAWADCRSHARRFLESSRDDKGDDVRDTRDKVVSLVGYLLIVAMGIAVLLAVMSH